MKEAGPLHGRHRVMMAAISVHQSARRGETPDPVIVDDTNVFYGPSRPGTGVVIRDFLGREHSCELGTSG